VTASALDNDNDAPVNARPRGGPGDLRLPGERPEAIPHPRFERLTELVTTRPPLHLDQLVAIESAQQDPVEATASAGAAAERNGRDRRAARLELLPDLLSGQELPPAAP
jgi:hypothetical protein